MNSNLKTAILEFLANEFKLDPKNIAEDTSFTTDLNLSPQDFTDLLTRMQEALDFVLPEDKIGSIITIQDLLQIIEPDDPTHDQTPV